MHFHPNVHSHEPLQPFHPPHAWERPGFAAHPVDIGNLVMILLGIALALALYPF